MITRYIDQEGKERIYTYERDGEKRKYRLRKMTFSKLVEEIKRKTDISVHSIYE